MWSLRRECHIHGTAISRVWLREIHSISPVHGRLCSLPFDGGRHVFYSLLQICSFLESKSAITIVSRHVGFCFLRYIVLCILELLNWLKVISMHCVCEHISMRVSMYATVHANVWTLAHCFNEPQFSVISLNSVILVCPLNRKKLLLSTLFLG